MADHFLGLALTMAAKREMAIAELFRAAEAVKIDIGPSAAEALYAVWTQHNADHPLLYTVLFNYAVVLTETRQLDTARDLLSRAIAINPEFMPAYINLGRIHEQLGQTGQAVAQWSRALAKMASVNGTSVAYKTTALNQMARTLEASQQDERAEDLLRQSLELDPDQREVAQHFVAIRQRQCEWPVVAPLDRVGRERLITSMSPLSAAIYADDPIFQMAVAWGYNRYDVGHPATLMRPTPKPEPNSGRIRIGYLSSDLREHSVGHLMAEVFGLHDRSRVEVFAYYCGIACEDDLQKGFKSNADHWCCITDMDDAAAARQIAGDRIQILIDLNGYTRDGRTKLVSLRPAPVIVNWLGYPGTAASPYHDYIVADPWIITPEHEIYYTEKVARLRCYQPTNRQRMVSAKPVSRAQAGLPEDAMVYCCFNGSQKITRFWFERWMAVLLRVPGSVLWLLSASAATNDRLRGKAMECGVDPSRLVFAERLPNAEHLARYRLADLFLDTFPYGAHTTGSDALWMGLPVLTLSGLSFASRVCGSLVRAAGLPELVSTTAEGFIDHAVALGHDRASLETYRERLVAGRDNCLLFNVPLLVNSLEDLFEQMWREYVAGEVPRPDLDNLEVCLEVGGMVNREERDDQTICDYHGWWKELLSQRHSVRPISEDRRLWIRPKRFELQMSAAVTYGSALPAASVGTTTTRNKRARTQRHQETGGMIPAPPARGPRSQALGLGD